MDGIKGPSQLALGDVRDFPPGSRKLVQAGSVPLLVVNDAGTYHAFVDFCPHRSGPLSEGQFEGSTVACPWHGARFDWKTGQCLSGPCRKPLDIRRVWEAGGRVFTDGGTRPLQE